jgi:hypothetical protein
MGANPKLLRMDGSIALSARMTLHWMCYPLPCFCLPGKYIDAEADPEEVVCDLEAMLQHISSLGEALQTYNRYFQLFDMAGDDMSALMLVEKEANSRYQVLGPKANWHRLCYEWVWAAVARFPPDTELVPCTTSQQRFSLPARCEWAICPAADSQTYGACHLTLYLAFLLSQLWGSLRDFVDQSHAWTEDAILDDDGGLLLNMDAIKVAVEEYGTRAYKAGKANKEVRNLHTALSLPGTKQRSWILGTLPSSGQFVFNDILFAVFVLGVYTQSDILQALIRLVNVAL